MSGQPRPRRLQPAASALPPWRPGRPDPPEGNPIPLEEPRCRLPPETPRPAARSAVPPTGAHSPNALRPPPPVRARFYNFCRLLGGANRSPARPRKVETIFGIQKGSCRTRTPPAPASADLRAPRQRRVRNPGGRTRPAPGRGRPPGRGEVRTGSAPRRGQVRDTLHPPERQVAARAAAPREARPGGNAPSPGRTPSRPGTRRPAPRRPRSLGHRPSPRDARPSSRGPRAGGHPRPADAGERAPLRVPEGPRGKVPQSADAATAVLEDAEARGCGHPARGRERPQRGDGGAEKGNQRQGEAGRGGAEEGAGGGGRPVHRVRAGRERGGLGAEGARTPREGAGGGGERDSDGRPPQPPVPPGTPSR